MSKRDLIFWATLALVCILGSQLYGQEYSTLAEAQAAADKLNQTVGLKHSGSRFVEDVEPSKSANVTPAGQFVPFPRDGKLRHVRSVSSAPVAVMQSAQAICKVSVQMPNGFGSSGTGTKIDIPSQSTDIILTCAHLVDRGMDWRNVNLVVEFWTEEKIRGKFIALDRESDTAWIKLDRRSSIKGAPLATEQAKVNDQIWHLGYKEGHQLQIKQSRVMDDTLDHGKTVAVSASSWMGMSGGPLIDKQGHVQSPISASDLTSFTVSCCNRFMLQRAPLFPIIRAGIQNIRRNRAAYILGIEQPFANQCPEGNCVPVQPQPQYQAPQIQPPQYQPEPTPAPRPEMRPIPGPVGERGPPGATGQTGPAGRDGVSPRVDYDKIIRDVVGQIPRPRDGVNGQRGEQGPPGRDAQITDDQLRAIATAVMQSLPSTPVRIVDPDTGEPYIEASLNLGQPLIIPYRRDVPGGFDSVDLTDESITALAARIAPELPKIELQPAYRQGDKLIPSGKSLELSLGGKHLLPPTEVEITGPTGAKTMTQAALGTPLRLSFKKRVEN